MRRCGRCSSSSRDFAAWQRELLDTRDRGRAARLLAAAARGSAGADGAARTTGSRPARQTFAATRSSRPSPGLARAAARVRPRAGRDALHDDARGASCVLLHRYSGAGEVIVGSGHGQPPRSRELDAMLGMFINTVALRVDLSDDPSVTRAARPRAGRRARGPGEPGRAVPAGGRGGRAGPQLEPHPALPDAVLHRRRAAARARWSPASRSCPTRALGTAPPRPRSTWWW